MMNKNKGFTLVELLIVIVVIAILAAIGVVAYNGIQQRSKDSRRDADVNTLIKAVQVARYKTGKSLIGITGNAWTIGACSSTSYNTGNVAPRTLPKTHVCWTDYRSALTKIATAAETNLDALLNGDPNGNPYGLNENQGESGDCAAKDVIQYSNNVNAAYTFLSFIPLGDVCP